MNVKTMILSFSIFFSVTIFSQPLSIEIRLDDTEYLIHEPIMLLIEVKNETDYPISYDFGLFVKEFKLNVIHNNNKIKCGESFISNPVTQSVTIEGGSSLYYYYQMLPFSCTNSINEKRAFLEHLIEGAYSIEVEYNFGKNILNNNEELVVNSNILEFKILQPQNKVYLAQLNQYIILMTEFRKYNHELFEKRILDIVAKDKLSPYSLLAQYRLVTFYQAKAEVTRYQKIMEKVCLENPNSFVSLSFAMYDKKILDNISVSKAAKGTLIQSLSKKVKESRTKAKFLD